MRYLSKDYNIKFCVFLGREKNMKILHHYIEIGLKNNILDEYHMYDFSRNEIDHNFIINEYERLSFLFNKRIFIHNYENKIFKNDEKTDWSPFYKNISNCSENDVIIKCDDDILFIDIFSLKNAIEDRINDEYSFLIHSNCINNGVCAYYQSNFFFKLKEYLSKYPTGGVLGVLFEKPEIAFAIHDQFCNDLISNIKNLNKYIINDQYIYSRISINFILLNGKDAKYLSDVSYDDEYKLSSFIPEKLCRPNKIKGDLLTSHLSYSFQTKILLKNDYILNLYNKIKNIYKEDIIVKYNNKQKENIYIPKLFVNNQEIFKVKNWFSTNNYYIKNVDTNQYLFIDYDEDFLKLSLDNKSIFEIITKKNNIIEIKLGIYYLTRYNILGKIRNENLFLKYFNNEREREIIKEDLDIDSHTDTENFFYLKFLKYNLYLGMNKGIIDLNIKEKSKWIFESVNNSDEYLYLTRFIKNDKFYYKNINNNEIYTNYYKGWAISNILL